jgi:hypothetical protein
MGPVDDSVTTDTKSQSHKVPLQTSRSSGRTMRPNVKQTLIAQTQPPMPPLLVPLTSTFRTRTDLHIFRNAPITLRILIICESYPFFLRLCLMLFVLSALLFTLREASSYRLSKGGCSLLVHIRPYSIFLFSITGYFYFRRVVRNDSLVRRLRRQRSRPCAVGRLGTIERRRRVTVLVKP